VDLAELRLRVKGHLERRWLQEELEELEKTLLVLVRAVEAKDAYTAGHGERVAQYALYGAEELGASPEELKDLRMDALLHDIGKIGIPDHILRGDHVLTEAEQSYIRRHPVLGDEILKPLKAHPRLRPYVRWHHQVVTAADIYDALTSVRTYRPPLKGEEALEVLEKEAREGKLSREAVRALRSGLLRNRALRAG
jgi:putative two-component system response regulator